MKKIIVFPAFGFAGYHKPDFPPNSRLADEVNLQAAKINLGGEPVEIFTDRQAAICLDKYNLKARVCPHPGNATATTLLFEWVATSLRSPDQVEVVIVAAPQHQPRAVSCAKKWGFQSIFLPRFERAPTDERFYWNPESIPQHACCWGPGWWRFYEGIGWLLAYWFPELHRRLAGARSR